MRLKISGRLGKVARNRKAIVEAIRCYAVLLNINPKQLYIRFTDKITSADMWQIENKHFTIRCSSRVGLYRTLQDLAHEMIHVEQFMKRKMTEKKSGTAWRGRVYRGNFVVSNDAYYNAPWEIDANGRSYWLYKRARMHLLESGFKLRRSN